MAAAHQFIVLALIFFAIIGMVSSAPTTAEPADAAAAKPVDAAAAKPGDAAPAPAGGAKPADAAAAKGPSSDATTTVSPAGSPVSTDATSATVSPAAGPAGAKTDAASSSTLQFSPVFAATAIFTTFTAGVFVF